MFCHNCCGTAIADQNSFCPACGAAARTPRLVGASPQLRLPADSVAISTTVMGAVVLGLLFLVFAGVACAQNAAELSARTTKSGMALALESCGQTISENRYFEPVHCTCRSGYAGVSKCWIVNKDNHIAHPAKKCPDKRYGGCPKAVVVTWVQDDIHVRVIGCRKVEQGCNTVVALDALIACQQAAFDRCNEDEINGLPRQVKFCGQAGEGPCHMQTVNGLTEFTTDVRATRPSGDIVIRTNCNDIPDAARALAFCQEEAFSRCQNSEDPSACWHNVGKRPGGICSWRRVGDDCEYWSPR